FSDAKILAVHAMFLWLVPLVLLTAINMLLEFFLNAERQFGRPESFAVAGRICSLLAIALFAHRFCVWSVVVGLWLAAAIQFLGYVKVLRRIGYRYLPILSADGFSILEIYKKLPSAMVHMACSQIFVFCVSAAVSALAPGTYAIYRYVSQIFSKINGL